MAKKRAEQLADVPFYDYLWQFYAENRKMVRRGYKQLTRRFLDFNDPETRADKDWSLRQPQFEALEMYVFLKEYCNNAQLRDIFADWQDRKGLFEGRGAFKAKIDELGLFETIDAQKFEAAFARLKASAENYPNYIYALTMGLGKTTLMATCIFYEFILANKFPKDGRYCHNALVFAPDRTVLQSLREIMTLDKAKVVPPGYVDWLNAHLKFHFLDDTSLSLQILEKSEYNIVISNNQKIILKHDRAEKGAGEKLFGAEKKYVAIAKPRPDYFGGLGDLGEDIETESDLVANQRFEMLRRLTNLGIYVDEAHHAFGKTLEKDFSGAGATSLRTTINELAAHLQRAGTHVVACYNYTGTPYVNNVLLPEVVYAYALKDAIDHRYLKQAEVKGYTNTRSKVFVKIVVRDFWEKHGKGGERVEGMLPKLAIFASDIDELDKEVRPAVEEALAELNVPAERILVNVGDSKLTTNDDLREFKDLDTPGSQKQFILLVGKGKEGWNCRSLFAVALHREPHSRVFVLQATMRCLRAIGTEQETGTVYLSEENRQILAEELQNNFRLNIDELTDAGDKGKKPVTVRIVPPPVTVKVKRIRKHYELKERNLNLTQRVDFKLDEIDKLKYAIVETKTDIKRIGRDEGVKNVVEGAQDNRAYSPLTLTAEVARYLGTSCIVVRRVLEESREGMAAVVGAINRHNEILYDIVIPTLFKHFYDLEEKLETEEVEMRLVKPITLKRKDGVVVDSDVVSERFMVKPELLAKRSDAAFAHILTKTFHLDNYCFDSAPECAFFKAVLEDPDIEHLYFTGMLTSDKTDFAISYIDPESNTLRKYYPDFLAQKKDGSYVIVEIKGENKLDDAVVQAKKQSAVQLAVANGMTYEMIPSKRAGYGLHQPPVLTPRCSPSGTIGRVSRDSEKN